MYLLRLRSYFRFITSTNTKDADHDALDFYASSLSPPGPVVVSYPYQFFEDGTFASLALGIICFILMSLSFAFGWYFGSRKEEGHGPVPRRRPSASAPRRGLLAVSPHYNSISSTILRSLTTSTSRSTRASPSTSGNKNKNMTQK